MRIIPKQVYIFFFFFLLVHTQIQAQLNGTYSVGPSVTDSFASISEAVDSLISQGISGPVIIKMQAGTYTEQIRIPEIAGTSPLNTITFQPFQPASSAVIIKYDSTRANNNYVFFLDSADHIKLKNLTFVSAKNDFGTIIQMQGGAHHNVIYGCRFEGAQVISSSTDHALIYSGSGTDTANIIDSNIFNYGSVAVFIGGGATQESYNVISRNICRDQYSTAIHVNTQKEPLITRNTVSSNSSVNQFYGIDLQACTGHARVLENKVYINNNGMGILYYDSYGLPGKEALIANNFVWVGGHSIAIGVYVNNSNTLNIYNNNINITSTSLGSAGRPVDIEPNATQDISVKNNNIVNLGQGFGLTTFSTIRVYSDYNNFYVPNGYLGYWNGYYGTSLAVWTNGTQQDSHSLNVNPTYYSHSDLHVNQFLLDSAALSMPLISNDIDGDPRNPLHPDIGADEFDVYNIDAGIIQLESPRAACPGIPIALSVRVRNFGTDTLRSLKIGWSVNDSLQSPLSVVDRISSLSTKVYNIGTYTFYPGIAYAIKIWTYAPNDSQDHYTANDTFVIDIFKTALQGQYSIGPNNRDYIGFGQAISDLISYGICGPVTFLVDSGNYPEQISIPEIEGASSLHPVTFRNAGTDPADVVISNNNVAWYSNYTMKISGSHIRFENMSIQANDPSLAIVIEIAGNASDIQFKGNRISGIQTNSVSIDYALIYAAAGNFLNDSIVFDSNEFLYGSFALYLTGPNVNSPEKGTRIRKNTFRDQYRQCMYLYAQDKPEITDNRIYSSSNYNNYHGIDLQYCVNGFDCSRNIVSSSDAAYAVYINRCTGSLNDKALISNNFIDAGGTQNMAVGIFISYSSFIDLYHNSIRIKNTNSNSRALFLSTDASYIRMKNNIFSNFGMGYAFFSTVNNNISSDYNNFYSNGPFLNYMLAAYTNLASYQAGSSLDSNSYSVDPRFIDNQNWHIRSLELDSAGTPLGILYDLDGETRSISHPDIGADEFTLLNYDAEMVEILSFNHVQCDGWIPVHIRVRNLGVKKLDSLKINWEINDVNQGNLILYSSLAFLKDTSFVIAVYKFDADSNYHVRVICSEPNGVQDQNAGNDTVDIYELKLLKFPEIDMVYGDTICPGDSALLRVLSSGAKQFHWYDSVSGGTLLGVEDTLLTGPLNISTVFYADAGSVHKPDSLMSVFESVPGNIGNGNMFEITALKSDIWIDSFGVHTQFDGGYPIWIYYKKGNYAGYENNPSAWTFLDSVFIQAKGSNNVSVIPHPGFTIPKGETYSVYISTTMVHYFNFSSGTGSFSDPNIQIYSGISLDYLFDASYAVNAVWNGKVYYSTGSYCQSSRVPVEVFVIPPADPHLPTDTAFCSGNQILLYAGPDSLYSYIWTKNYQTQTISESNALLVDTSGIYIVRMKDPCGNTAFDTVHVQKGEIPVAAFQIQDSSLCLVDNLFVFQNQSFVSQGNLSYYWFFGDGTSSRATEPQHSYLKDSIYTVKLLAVSNLGCKDSTEKNVEVHPMPVASFVITDSLQCLNENLFSFQNTSTIKKGTLNYTWIFDDEGSSNLKNPEYHFDTVGVRKISLISYSDELCYDSFSAYVRTVRNPEVDLGPDTVVCAHKAILLYAGSDYDAWFWPDSSTLPGLIADSNGFGLGDRLYWVRVQKNNCYGYDTVIVSFVICGSIQRTGPEMLLKIYPNPAENLVFLECEKEEAEQGLLCEILDQNGRLLQQEIIHAERTGISLESLSAALYFLRISNKESSVIFKIIKK